MKVELRAGATGVSRAKDERARERDFDAAFEDHFDTVMAYAIRRTSSRADAEDAVAETFVVAWRRWDDRPSSLLPWLYGIARRVLANARRGDARRQALASKVSASSETSAHDHAERVDSDASILSALRSLPRIDREVIFLTEWEGLRGRDAAKVLGCSVAALHVRLFRARRRLLAQLDPDPEPYEAASKEAR